MALDETLRQVGGALSEALDAERRKMQAITGDLLSDFTSGGFLGQIIVKHRSQETSNPHRILVYVKDEERNLSGGERFVLPAAPNGWRLTFILAPMEGLLVTPPLPDPRR